MNGTAAVQFDRRICVLTALLLTASSDVSGQSADSLAIRAANRAQNRVELLRHNIFGSYQCRKSQRKDSQRVRNRNDHPQQSRVLCCAAGANQVGCNHRLAMSRR